MTDPVSTNDSQDELEGKPHSQVDSGMPAQLGRRRKKGLILGLLCILVILAIVLPMVIPQFFGDTPDVVSSKNLRQLAIGGLTHEASFSYFPYDLYDSEAKPLLSWRVMILRCLGRPERELFEKFNLNEPWDSPQNLEAAKNMPEVFKRPGFDLDAGMTVYKRPIGNNALFNVAEPYKKEIPADAPIADGDSYTIMFVECRPEDAVFWSQPQTDFPFDPQNPRQGLFASQSGFIFAMGHGGVQTFEKSVSDEELRWAFTCNVGDGPSKR